MTKRLFSAAVSLVVVGLASVGCGRAEERCDLKCECELCSDRKYDECVIGVDYAIDRAAALECSEDYDAYFDCYVDRADCDNDTYSFGLDGDDCSDEAKDLFDCCDSASDPGDDVCPYF